MRPDGPPAAAGRGPLTALLTDLAAGLPGVRVTTDGEGIEWSRAGVTFGVLAGGALELRLDPAVAAAALRTPDTAESSRGMPWIHFEPSELDSHAIDRVTAWFAFAYRRAGAT